MSVIRESRLVSFFVYNPTLSKKEGTEHLKIIYYFPEEEIQNRKVRNIGLCEALVHFTKTFHPSRPCEAVHTQRLRQVFYEAEPDHWMIMTVSIPWAEVVNNGEKSIVYYEEHVQNSVLNATLIKAYNTFKLFNGCFTTISEQFGVEGLKLRAEKFFSRYLMTVNISQLDIFSVFQGIQFLPLDKYMYLKVHCFVNLIETSFRCIHRTVLLCNDCLIWSGLEQEDTKVFYQYLLSWLFPSRFSPDYVSVVNSVTQSVAQSLAASVKPSPVSAGGKSHTGSFVIGDTTGVSGHASLFRSTDSNKGPPPWVYIVVDGQTLGCKLYVYSAGNATMCFFVQNEKESPTQDFCKRLGTFLGPRLAGVSQEITDYREKTKTTGVEQLYRFIYFNEMNLAVKSPALSQRPPHMAISTDIMRLLTEVNAGYDDIDEGETIMRTMANYWVASRKSGHRRFFVVFTQKNANFADINEEVRKLCQKEFTNIFFLD